MRVERPPKLWHFGQFLRQRDLVVVPRHAFMHGQCRQFIQRPLVEGVGIDKVITAALPTYRR